MLIYLFFMNIKDLLKFPLVHDIAIIIPFSYSAYDIMTFLFVNICLARDLFKELEADF